MKRVIIILAFSLITAMGYGQALPVGSVPFGTQLWIAPDGGIWTGTGNNGFKGLVTLDNFTFQDITNNGNTTNHNLLIGPNLQVRGAAGIASISLQGSQTRFSTGTTSDADGGNFFISRYNDSGLDLGPTMSINRATGNTVFDGTVAGLPAVSPGDFVVKSQLDAFDLQFVTDIGNVSTNALAITGSDGVDPNSTATYYAQHAIYNVGGDGFAITSILDGSPLAILDIGPNEFSIGAINNTAKIGFGEAVAEVSSKKSNATITSNWNVISNMSAYTDIAELFETGANRVFTNNTADLGAVHSFLEAGYDPPGPSNTVAGIHVNATESFLDLQTFDSGQSYRIVKENGDHKLIIELPSVIDSAGVDIRGSNGTPLVAIDSEGNIEIVSPTSGIILTAPNSAKYRITVDNTGTLQTTEL